MADPLDNLPLWEGVGFFNEGSPGPVLKIRLSQRT
jgi:hypothetical protein